MIVRPAPVVLYGLGKKAPALFHGKAPVGDGGVKILQKAGRFHQPFQNLVPPVAGLSCQFVIRLVFHKLPAFLRYTVSFFRISVQVQRLGKLAAKLQLQLQITAVFVLFPQLPVQGNAGRPHGHVHQGVGAQKL